MADLVKPLNFDASSRLYYDRNNDDLYQAQEAIIDQMAPANGIVSTPELELWRKLHVEVDSMGPVQGNTVHDTSTAVRDNGDGTYTVSVIGELENDRFENGGLQDSQGYLYPVVENDASTVTVRQGNNPTPPWPNGDVWLWDDDAQVMPEMPDTGLMEEAYGAAYIYPVIDGEGDPANNKTIVAFASNIAEGAEAIQIEKPNGIESHQNRGPAYWVGYIQASYQGDARWDGDPDVEQEDDRFILGVTVGPNERQMVGSLVFQEAIRDLACSQGWSAAAEALIRQRTVVHEIGHQFGLLDDDIPLVPSIMARSIATDPQDPAGSRFNEYQQGLLRGRVNSPGLWE